MSGDPFFVQVGIASQYVLGASPTRQALAFIPPAQGRITLSTHPNVVLDLGWTVIAGQGPLILRREDWGDMLTKQWFAIADSQAPQRNLGIIEAVGP